MPSFPLSVLEDDNAAFWACGDAAFEFGFGYGTYKRHIHRQEIIPYANSFTGGLEDRIDRGRLPFPMLRGRTPELQDCVA